MMKKQVASIVLAVSVAGGVGTGVLANALTTNDPVTASQTPPDSEPSPSATPTPGETGGDVGVGAPDALVVVPGAVGPVKVGMSKAEALDTGYFVADVPAPVDGCPEQPLTWKDEYVNTYDVQTLGNGEISSIGIFGEGADTDRGVGVRSTYDEVVAAYPDEQVVEAGYLQAGIRIFDVQNGGWVGFLFDTTVDAISGDDPVTFMEVTKSAEPSLMRDGC